MVSQSLNQLLGDFLGNPRSFLEGLAGSFGAEPTAEETGLTAEGDSVFLGGRTSPCHGFLEQPRRRREMPSTFTHGRPCVVREERESSQPCLSPISSCPHTETCHTESRVLVNFSKVTATMMPEQRERESENKAARKKWKEKRNQGMGPGVRSTQKQQLGKPTLGNHSSSRPHWAPWSEWAKLGRRATSPGAEPWKAGPPPPSAHRSQPPGELSP